MLLSIAGLIYLANGWTVRAEQQVLAKHSSHQAERAARIAGDIGSRLHDCEQQLVDIAHMAMYAGQDPRSNEGANEGQPEDYYRRFTSSTCGKLTVFSASGTILYSAREDTVGAASQPAELWKWAAAPDRATGSARLFGPFSAVRRAADAPTVPRVMFDLVVPVFRYAGALRMRKLAGVVTFQMPLGQVLTAAQALSADALESELWIVDDEGVLLWQSEHPKMMLKRVPDAGDPRLSKCQRCHTSFDYLDRIVAEKRGSASYQLRDKPKKLVAYAPMQFRGVGWVVAINSSYDEITLFQRQNVRQYGLIALALLVVVSGGLMLAYRSYRRRLRAEQEAEHWRSKQALEREVQQSEQRYGTIFETANDLIWALDGDGLVAFVNPRMAEISSRAAADWPGLTLADHVHEDDQEALARALNEAKAGEAQTHELRLGFEDGQYLTLSVNTVARRERDEVVGTVSFGRDITEQRKAERELLRKSESERVVSALLRLALMTAPLQEKLQRALEVILSTSWLPLSPRAGIFLSSDEGDVLELHAHKNFPDEQTRICGRVEYGRCICGRVAAQNELLFVSTCDDTRHEHRWEDMTPHAHYAAPISSDTVVHGVLILYLPDGHRSSPVEESFLGMVADTLAGIIRHDEAQQAMHESEERYMLAAEGSSDGMWDWDLEKDVMFFSDRWLAMLGLSRDAVAPELSTWLSRVHPDNRDELGARLDAHLEGGTQHFECEYRIRHGDGTYRWALSRGLGVRDENGKPLRMAGSLTDISERKAAEQELLHSVFRDSLTGLPNRALFLDRAGRCLERQKRQPGTRFAVLLVDVDQFKVINDSLGHHVGDRLLRGIAERLMEVVRDADTVARLGGDEFALLLEDIADVSDTTRVAARLAERLRRAHDIEGHELFATASVGIALSATGYEKPDDMLRDAETAMYRAKARGRGHHQLFDKAMHAEALAAMRLESDLRRAVEREQFVLHYQPIIAIDSGRVVGVEVLVRWNHPDRGLLYPDSFISLAEETRDIVDLGEWILHQACVQGEKWHRAGHADLRVAVNVSPRQFEARDMRSVVATTLDRTGMQPQCLELELTEMCIMESSESNIATLRDLSAQGVTIALDDFGAGHSSLYRLKHLPIEVVKIDRTFIKDLATSSEDEAITGAIVEMAHSLGLSVTCEGVEETVQLDLVSKLGCDRAQGYLLGRPVSAEETTKLLASGATLPVS